MRKLTLEEIKKRLVNINSNIEIISKKYIDSKTHLDCRCKICGYEWKAIWNSLSKGVGCPKCSGKAKLTIEEVKKRVKEIHSNIRILDKEYENIHSKLNCYCLICGHKWKTSYSNLFHNKTDCPKCTNRLKHDINEVKKIILKINPNIKVLSNFYKNNKSLLLCECKKCGYEWNISFKDLMAKKGCPLCNASNGEKIIYKWLKNHNFTFKFQYKFDDCKYKMPLPFDFYLLKCNTCIEYDGELHYKQTTLKCNLKVQQIRDDIKNKYCNDNGIRLIRIPYWKQNRIGEILQSILL